jgi:Protein of unknown function (DUF3099)
MAREPEPIRITTASRSHNDDIAARQKRYLISMSIRTVCFILTVVSIGHWFLWVFLVGSLVLPPIAVIVANTSNPPDPGGPARFTPEVVTRALEGPDGRPPLD